MDVTRTECVCKYAHIVTENQTSAEAKPDTKLFAATAMNFFIEWKEFSENGALKLGLVSDVLLEHA